MGKKTVVALGSFDGVHLGHQKIISKLLQLSEQLQLKPVIVTFFPHPTHILSPNRPLPLINTIEERVDLIKKYGVSEVYVQTFSKSFSKLSAQDFVVQTLLNKFNMTNLLLGYDHCFGHNKEGNYEYLSHLGKKQNFKVHQIKPHYVKELLVSSTLIRQHLVQGNIQLANKMLGKKFSISGKVTQGNQLGRKIGFNTANIVLNYSNKIVPKDGVYIVQSTIEGVLYRGMMNIGLRPTVNGESRTIEVHYFDLNKDLYSQNIKVEILSRIRDESKFSSLEALQQQLKLDKITALKYVNNI